MTLTERVEVLERQMKRQQEVNIEQQYRLAALEQYWALSEQQKWTLVMERLAGKVV